MSAVTFKHSQHIFSETITCALVSMTAETKSAFISNYILKLQHGAAAALYL